MQGTLICGGRADPGRQGVTFTGSLLDKARQATWFFTTLIVPRDDHRSTTSVDLGVTDKFQQVNKFTNIESTNTKDQSSFITQMIL